MGTQNNHFLKRIVLSLIFSGLLTVFLVPASAQEPDDQEWVILPVIVNIVDDSDASKLDDAIKVANEIFKQANIRLVVKKTNQNVEIGDKDGELTEKEGDQALRDGQREIENTFQDEDGNWDGTGLKITLADDCWVEEPGTIGWAVHRKPVVVVESADANSVGSTIVHELIHVLTVTDHRDDPNDVMYPTDEGGTLIDPNDIKEIFPEAKKRGTAFRLPRLPAFRGWRFSPFFVSFSTTLRGATLDDFDDVLIEGQLPPDAPTVAYADIREVSFFAENPFTPGAVGRLEIHRGAVFPEFAVNSFFDIYFEIDPMFPGPDLLIQVHGLTQGGGYAAAIDLQSGEVWTLPEPVQVHTNEKFDGSIPILYDHTVELLIPIELLQLNLHSANPVLCQVNSFNEDHRLGEPIFLLDQTEPFAIRLTGCCIEPRLEMEDISRPGQDVMALKGCGFAPNDPIRILINDVPAGTALTNAQGEFVFSIRPWMPLPDDDDLGVSLEPGRHEILAISADDSRPRGAAFAIGYAAYCPQGVPTADLTGDCVVDLHDLAVLASQWLAGTHHETIDDSF